MQIKITAREFGATEFLAQPHRLHLGAQQAEGVDRLRFLLPEQWAGCAVTLHIRHADGTLAQPLVLDEEGCVPVGRSFTGWASGEWMLAAADGEGYAAYTRPGQYDVHGILPTEDTGEELTPSVYEQFIARVMESATAAADAAKRAAAAEESVQQSTDKAAAAVQQAAAHATLASGYSEKAEAAASRAEAIAPADGTVLSVNGKGGTVRLSAQDVWALPRPLSPKGGQLVRVVSVNADTGALTTDTVSASEVGGLGSSEKELLLRLLGSAQYTDDTAQDSYNALKELWQSVPAPDPEPDIIPVERVTLNRTTLELSRNSTFQLIATVSPSDATDQTVLWSAEPEGIVSVENGSVTALKMGTATITAHTADRSASCAVTVTPAVYRVQTTQDDNGKAVIWDDLYSTIELFMPLTAKRSGLKLRALEFSLQGYLTGTLAVTLRRYGASDDLFTTEAELNSTLNELSIPFNDLPLEKGVEYQLRLYSVSKFYSPVVQPEQVVENDYLDIVHGSAYCNDNSNILFSGTAVLVDSE